MAKASKTAARNDFRFVSFILLCSFLCVCFIEYFSSLAAIAEIRRSPITACPDAIPARSSHAVPLHRMACLSTVNNRRLLVGVFQFVEKISLPVHDCPKPSPRSLRSTRRSTRPPPTMSSPSLSSFASCHTHLENGISQTNPPIAARNSIFREVLPRPASPLPFGFAVLDSGRPTRLMYRLLRRPPRALLFVCVPL